MTLRAFMEALKTDVSVILKEQDGTTIAEFSRSSYRAISSSYLTSEIDDIEIRAGSSISVVITLEEDSNVEESGNEG